MIRDISGRVVQQKKYAYQMDIKNLEDGLYTAELKAIDKPLYKVKFIVTR